MTAAQKPCNTSSITHQCSQCLQTVKERIISLLHFSYATFAIRPKDRFFRYKFYISRFCNHSQKKFQSKSKTLVKSTNEEYCQIPFNAINFSIIKKWTLYLTGSINSRILDPFIWTQRLVCCYILQKMKQINKSYFYHRGLLPLKKYMILVHIICTRIIFF